MPVADAPLLPVLLAVGDTAADSDCDADGVPVCEAVIELDTVPVCELVG